MKELTNKKLILWDFDGVIIESNEVREYGFRQIFKNYSKSEIEKLLEFHRLNGGLSRYVKIHYFFEQIIGRQIEEKEVDLLADKFSVIMREELTKKEYLISETVDFIKSVPSSVEMHIVSGSDQNELRYLCKKLEIETCFKSIQGSPTPKNTLVKNILDTCERNKNESVLIGDSINDYEAADINGIDFMGYNNPTLKGKGAYINSFVC